MRLEMFTCDIDVWLEQYSPHHIDSKNIEECLSKLLEEKVTVMRDKKCQWNNVPVFRRGQKMRDLEDEAAKFYYNIAQAICAYNKDQKAKSDKLPLRHVIFPSEFKKHRNVQERYKVCFILSIYLDRLLTETCSDSPAGDIRRPLRLEDRPSSNIAVRCKLSRI